MPKQIQRKRYYYDGTSSSDDSSKEKPGCSAKSRKRSNSIVRSFFDLNPEERKKAVKAFVDSSAEEQSQDSSASTRNSNGQDGDLLRYVLLSKNANAPERATDGSAGYDLSSAYDYEVNRMTQMKIETDLAVGIPSGCYGRLSMRSGLASRYSLQLLGGVIDRDYTGAISVLIFNGGGETYVVKKGQRIAQLICEQILTPETLEVKELEKTERDHKGFGSTGI